MTQIVVSVSGNQEVAAKLRRIGLAAVNLSEPMDNIGSYLSRFFAGEVFASRGRVIGEPWPALNPAYAAYKARRWPGRPPLMRTNLMNSSFTHDAGRLSVTISNEAEYFRYHQEGTSEIPARVMMKVDQARANRIVDVINGHLNKAMA